VVVNSVAGAICWGLTGSVSCHSTFLLLLIQIVCKMASHAPRVHAPGDDGSTSGPFAAGHHPPPTPPPPPLPPPAALLPTPCSLPALHVRPALEARRGAARQEVRISSARPGALLQDRFLLDFHHAVVPGPSTSPTAFIWITPSSLSARYNLFFVRNAVNFLLTVYPSRLHVVQVRPRVFRVTVACQVIANALVVRGSLRLSSSVLHVHLSLEDACKAAMAVQEEVHFDLKVDEAVIAPPEQGATPDPAFTSVCSDVPSCTAQDNPAGKEQPLGLFLDSPDPGMPDFGGARATSPPASTCRGLLPTAAPLAVNTPHQTAAKSYADALRTPTKTTPRARKPLPPITATNVCFRCLSPEHCVRNCRDPVRCRNCGGLGHRRWSCMMPIARELTPFHPRRRDAS
jgi:hypothetical protein